MYRNIYRFKKSIRYCESRHINYKNPPLRYTWLTITLVKELFNKNTSISTIKNEISDEYFSNYGVPQGTVLGPIFFFNIYK